MADIQRLSNIVKNAVGTMRSSFSSGAQNPFLGVEARYIGGTLAKSQEIIEWEEAWAQVDEIAPGTPKHELDEMKHRRNIDIEIHLREKHKTVRTKDETHGPDHSSGSIVAWPACRFWPLDPRMNSDNPKELLLTFGQRLRFIRETLGLSQLTFSIQCGLGYKNISHYENDAKSPGLTKLVKILQSTGIKPEWLLFANCKDILAREITEYYQINRCMVHDYRQAHFVKK